MGCLFDRSSDRSAKKASGSRDLDGHVREEFFSFKTASMITVLFYLK